MIYKKFISKVLILFSTISNERRCVAVLKLETYNEVAIK